MMNKEISGNYSAPQGKVAIVASRFNEIIVQELIKGANDIFIRHGLPMDKIEIFRVPGAFEIPLICQQLAKTKRYAGLISLGAVIRGSTPHFDYVAGACANGVLQAQMATQIPIIFGVLTTDTVEQAMERAGCKAGNKGSECALALLETMDLLGKINE